VQRRVKHGEQLMSAAERDLNPQMNQRRRKDVKQQRRVRNSFLTSYPCSPLCVCMQLQQKITGQRGGGVAAAAASADMDEGDDDSYQFGKYYAMK
jgi:hypothetical protein